MTRHHDFDALRAFAMLLGIVLHASVFLLPIANWPDNVEPWPASESWAQTTAPEENPYSYVFSFIHGFRMPVFFLISGFFTAMLLRSRGLDGLARHRLKRIGLPLLVSVFTIVPVVAWLFTGSGFDPLYWPLAWLDGFRHLWFLWYLLLMVALLVLLVPLGVNLGHRIWWLLIPLTVVPQYFMAEHVFGVDTPPLSVFPTAQMFGYYAVFFYFGVFFHERGFTVRRWWSAGVLAAVLIAFPGGMILLYPEIFLGSDAGMGMGRVLGVSVCLTPG